MAPPWLPTAEGPPKPSQHPALALRQRDEASTGTQQLDVMDDLQQNSRNTKVVPEPGQSNHTAVTQMFDTTLKHTDTLRDGLLSTTKQNTMTPTQNSSQTQAPMVQIDGNSHSSKPTTEAGPPNGLPAASECGSTIDNPEVCPLLPSYSEDEVREAIKAILNPETRPISPSHDQGALHEAVKEILNENSTKAYIQVYTNDYIEEWLKSNRSAIMACTREEVSRQLRDPALWKAVIATAVPDAYTAENRPFKATDAAPTLPEVHPLQVPDAESVTTSTEMMHPRTSDAADAGSMSDRHSQDSQKGPGDCFSDSNNKTYRS